MSLRIHHGNVDGLALIILTHLNDRYYLGLIVGVVASVSMHEHPSVAAPGGVC
jgi:hypothetical protein